MASGNKLTAANNFALRGNLAQYWLASSVNLSLYNLRYIVTYPHVGPTNINLRGSYGGTYYYWVDLRNSNSNAGTIAITSPFSEGPSYSGILGQNKQVYNGVYTTITLVASPVYGHTFKGWYTAETGGTLISTSSTYGIGPTNIAMTNTTSVYAQWYNPTYREFLKSSREATSTGICGYSTSYGYVYTPYYTGGLPYSGQAYTTSALTTTYAPGTNGWEHWVETGTGNSYGVYTTSTGAIGVNNILC